MMECRLRTTEIVDPGDACATDHGVEAPPIGNQILAVVAHELRGPLTPLRMASQLIRSASAGRPEILRLTDMIDRQVDGIERLAQDLMDAMRCESIVTRSVSARPTSRLQLSSLTPARSRQRPPPQKIRLLPCRFPTRLCAFKATPFV